MEALRQTHLGSTATKLLTIVDLQGPREWPCTIVHPIEAYILHLLPDELLVLILKLSSYDTSPPSPGVWTQFKDVTKYDSKCVMALSQVCHRFKRIAQPLLFSTISSSGTNPMVPPSMPVLRLHRTLRERADLRQHCRWVSRFSFSTSLPSLHSSTPPYSSIIIRDMVFIPICP